MFNLTQVDLAEKSGVGLRFVRELEQGKETLRIDKINQVLALFGHEVGAVPQHLNSSTSQHHNISQHLTISTPHHLNIIHF